MKVKSILFALLIISLSATAQKTPAPKETKESETPSIEYRAELSYGQSFRYGNYTVTAPSQYIKGGLNIEIPLQYGLGIETGLSYSYDFGKRNQLYAHSDTASFNYKGHYLDIPVRVAYTLPIFWGLKLFGYAGPSFGIGLAHTETVKFTAKTVTPAPTNPLDYPKTGTYNSFDEELNRINIQLGAGGGVQWKSYRLKSGYDWGLNNISKHKAYPQRTKGWYVAFEYEF